MEIVKWILISVSVIFSLIFLIFAKRTKSVVKTFLLFAATGMGVLLLLTLLKPYLGLQLSINPFTVITSAALGIPGIIALIVVPMFF